MAFRETPSQKRPWFCSVDSVALPKQQKAIGLAPALSNLTPIKYNLQRGPFESRRVFEVADDQTLARHSCVTCSHRERAHTGTVCDAHTLQTLNANKLQLLIHTTVATEPRSKVKTHLVSVEQHQPLQPEYHPGTIGFEPVHGVPLQHDRVQKLALLQVLHLADSRNPSGRRESKEPKERGGCTNLCCLRSL